MIYQLAKLNEKRPDICRANLAPTPVQYFIGEYGFWGNSAGELIACPMGLLDKNIGGRGALAWLRDAIEGEIEKRGWAWELFSSGDGLIWVDDTTYESEVGLLAAFLAAVEEEGR